MMKNKYVILLVLFTIFILVRIPVIITSADKMFSFFELYIGTIAKELIEGPTLPLFDYQLTHNKGGTLLTGIILAPFFRIFGQSYFVLKLVALLYSLLILAIIYLFLWRFFSKKIAITTGILMAISAPIYTISSLVLYGRNHEPIICTMIALFLFYKIFFPDTSIHIATHKKIYLFALLGLVSGLGMYCDYVFAVTLIFCLAFWFIFDKVFFIRRDFWSFVVFFVVGLSPWIYYNLTHNFAAICINDDYPGVPLWRLFFSNSLPQVAAKLKDFLVYHLPNSFYFSDFKFIPGDVISYAYYGIFILAFCVLFWSNKKTIWKLLCSFIPSKKNRLLPGSLYREAFILLYPVAFSLLYSFSYYILSKKSEYNFFGFHEYRFLFTLYPFIFIIISIFLSRLWDLRGRRRTIAVASAIFIFLFLMASGLSADYNLITPRKFGRHLVYEGYNYHYLGRVIGERYGHSIPEAAGLAENIRQPYQAAVFRGIGYNIGWRFFRGKEYADIDVCIAHINKIKARYLPFVFKGFGAFLELHLKDRSILHVAPYANSVDKRYRQYVYQGMGWLMGWRFKDRFFLSIEKINKIDEEYKPDCYRGLGEMTGMVFGRDMIRCAELMTYIDSKYRRHFFQGFTGNP